MCGTSTWAVNIIHIQCLHFKIHWKLTFASVFFLCLTFSLFLSSSLLSSISKLEHNNVVSYCISKGYPINTRAHGELSLNSVSGIYQPKWLLKLRPWFFLLPYATQHHQMISWARIQAIFSSHHLIFLPGEGHNSKALPL